MTTIYSPKEKGFSDALHHVDRCQVILLREIAFVMQNRMVLKGGMAMRASVGSMRLTKDMDFDRDISATTLSSVKGLMKKGMKSAAVAGRIQNAEISITKDTETTLRARLVGQTPQGSPIRFEVEVSGRSYPQLSNRHMEMVSPPTEYGVAPFTVNTYSHEMLAASKVLAVMADNRNVPRDIYDLKDLADAGVDPAEILCELPPEALAQIRADVLGKLTLITFDLAKVELLPYLPPSTAASVDAEVWDSWTLKVAESIEGWIDNAARLQQSANVSVQSEPLVAASTKTTRGRSP